MKSSNLTEIWIQESFGNIGHTLPPISPLNRGYAAICVRLLLKPNNTFQTTSIICRRVEYGGEKNANDKLVVILLEDRRGLFYNIILEFT
jgi:hypothetical protein